MFIRNLLPQIMFEADPGAGGGSNPNPDKPTLSAENVTAFLTENPTVLSEVLKSEVAKPSLQPLMDSHFSKSLETWKANNLDKIVNERVETLFPNETPQAKQMRELQQQIDRINAEKQEAMMANVVTKSLVENELPTSFARFIKGANETEVQALVADLKYEFTTALNGSVDSKFKQFGHTPQANQTNNQSQAKDPGSMNYQERMALYQSNPNEYKRLFG